MGNIRRDQEPFAFVQGENIHEKYEYDANISVAELLHNTHKDGLMLGPIIFLNLQNVDFKLPCMIFEKFFSEVHLQEHCFDKHF